ncbi:receptor-like protein EIX2 [Musa acuminata AAA Group]|uniref:receptor-like protein EIX2 n=1 Tax=Musa acuminata AAA Group TaxID=214697 RepID=UPI0031DF2EC9
MLDGDIPPNLSKLSALQFIDLADNKLSGSIPRSFGNFTAMKVIGKFSSRMTDATSFEDQMLVTTKGRTQDYEKSLSLMNILDLSDNNLFGEILEELTSLSGLFSLNLSGNHFTGEIIENISKLQQLESLDLSRNNFSGTIPSGLAALTYLAHLNLSYNNLSGEIPLGNQLLTFTDPSIYIGNPGLCGFPLNQSCKDSETTQGQNNADDGDENEMIWFYTSMAPGFVVGFWAVWGTLILNKNWNLYYFRFIDNMLDKVYVLTVLKVSRIRKRCCSQQG